MGIRFTFNGRPIDPRKIGNAFAREVQSEMPAIISATMVAEAKKKLHGFQCPEHKMCISRIWTQSRGKKLSLRVDGCCEEFVAAAVRKLSQD